MGQKHRFAPPKPSAMLESLRGLGYSAATALADIIDNSIAASASVINLNFHWDESESWITVLDNGCGMSDQELDRAMRLGDRSPTEEREAHDLGRFGLGLKTASFSQCRRLTVASKKNDEISCLRWDLDVLASSADSGWYLLEGCEAGSEHLLHALDHISSGTLVIWQVLDRIVTRGYSQQNYLDLIDQIESHLSMVFHRYLERKKNALIISINGKQIQPWDPFLTSHSMTWSSPLETIPYEDSFIRVQCHVLPHKDKLDDKTYATAAGLNGWTAQQGFYVYRNERLLIAGSWLELGLDKRWTKEEAYRLARIRVDISNLADKDWKIDIRKSKASLPVSLRARLTKLADDTRKRARRVFAHRGKALTFPNKDPVKQAWNVKSSKDGVRYHIDREHPSIQSVLENAGVLAPQIQAMLRVIEETVPIQRIWLDTTEQNETPQNGFEGVATEDVLSVLNTMYKSLIKKEISPDLARKRLLRTEPFDKYPDLVASLPDEVKDI